jgi:predicted permease
MLRSNLTVAIRNLLKYRGFSIINVVGLSLGIAACIVIMLWVRFEISFDKFNENLDDLYLVGTKIVFAPRVQPGRQSPPALARALREEFPEVVDATLYNPWGSWVVEYENTRHRETVVRVDRGFFEMFTYPFVAGDPASALDDRYSIVLSANAAKKYFGDQDPIGKTVRLDYRFDLTVTGVMEGMPSNSTFRWGYVIRSDLITALPGREGELLSWGNNAYYTVVQLRPGTDWQAFEDKIAGRAKKADPNSNTTFFLFPWSKVHLHSVHGIGGRIGLLVLISWLALIILFIGCLNFMNLATARASLRAREVGVRKVVGATRGDLVRQFYLESFLQSFLALALSLLIVEQFLPWFRSFTGLDLRLDYLGDPVLPVGALAITVLAGLVSGGYPALFLSAFRPVAVLRGRLAAGTRGVGFRRALVVIQFAAAVLLIVFSSVVYAQFDHLMQVDVGYDRDEVLSFNMRDDEKLRHEYGALKSSLLAHPNVEAVTKANRSPAGVYTNGSGWSWEGKDPNFNPLITYLDTGLDFLEVFGIEMVEGRHFSESDRQDGSAVVINETLARMMGEGPTVGKTLERPPGYVNLAPRQRVVGVIRDFRFKTASQRIEPLLMRFDSPRSNDHVFVRIGPEDVEDTLAFIEDTYHRFSPDTMFEYSFLSDQLDRLYLGVEKFGHILRGFAYLAVFISCLGLYGLASFITERRSKEIGIRKVVGASVLEIVARLTWDFLKWVALANVVAIPVTFVYAAGFLNDYASRVPIRPHIFILAAAATLGVAAVSVSIKAIRAALINPVDAIRYE